METVASICAYCGCGCRLLFIVDDGRIVKMLPDRTDNPSEGVACIKGLTLHETLASDEGRILSPMIRDGKDDRFHIWAGMDLLSARKVTIDFRSMTFSLD